MTQTEMEEAYEQIEYRRYRVQDFATDAGLKAHTAGFGGGPCCLCPQDKLAGPIEVICHPTGCRIGYVWVPKEHVAIIKIAYRRQHDPD